jgi:hypothetical protein
VFKGYCIQKGCFVFVIDCHFGKGCHNGEMLLGKDGVFIQNTWLAYRDAVHLLSRFTCFRRPPGSGDKNRRLWRVDFDCLVYQGL